ncbi:heavy metal sensor histidine kinase [Halodesulfovibrio aestuarii]|uniref:histidine kinase n=1 Tax=Halodesulfovibrio aestuarii TaxID=126333 RepID=A0A8G2C7V2_9BACT|nr:heavy metal sensor histidine kinase [Halodesulfovibrio aestuarii]SHI71166.1 two-component system, OmpR family, heavy metal sensor histidine kinase CusS [Halodesulfovibrio aestuarii]
MFSKPKNKFGVLRTCSLQARLAVAFAVITTLIVCATSFSIYSGLKTQLRTEDKQEFIEAATFIRDAVETLSITTDSKSWQLIWEYAVNAHGRLGVRVFSTNNELYLSTPNMNIPSEVFSLSNPPKYGVWTDPKSNIEYRTTSFLISTAPGQTWRVDASYDLSPTSELLSTYRWNLMILLLAGILLSVAISWFVSGYGLRPLRHVTTSIQGISSEHLSERIGEQPWPEELAGLAKSFDAMLERLEEAFTELSQFSADIAHEMRTPVNNMLSAASVMLNRNRDVAEYKQTLETIELEATHLSRLIENMLFLTRTEHMQAPLSIEECSIQEEFQFQYALLEALAEEKQVELRLQGEGVVTANKDLLRRALLNLVGNALRFTPTGGLIQLASEHLDGFVKITVSDTGSGIEAHHLPHIFTRFYRADIARADRSNTGLGLAFVQTIMAAHGGSVSVDTEVGKGTTFTLLFPDN